MGTRVARGHEAHAVLTDVGQKTAKVIDLSYGGVALLFEKEENSQPILTPSFTCRDCFTPVRVILFRKSLRAFGQRRPHARRLLLRLLGFPGLLEKSSGARLDTASRFRPAESIDGRFVDD